MFWPIRIKKKINFIAQMFCDRFHHLLLHESWTAHATKHRLDLPISHTMAISLNYDSLFMIFRFKISLKSFLPVWVIFCSAFFKSFVSWIDRSWWSSRFSYKKEPFTINKKKFWKFILPDVQIYSATDMQSVPRLWNEWKI